MTARTASIPVFTLQRLYPLPTSYITRLPRGVEVPFISTEEMRHGNTTRPLQSSTSFRKPATVSRERNAGIPRLTAITAKSTREPPYMPTPLPPLPLLGKVVLH
jgi:hypothetical protein